MPPRLPYARHPLNHFKVQALALEGALSATYDGARVRHSSKRKAWDLLAEAKTVAGLSTPYPEALGDTAFSPLRLLAQRAKPHQPLPPLPRSLHDPVTYAEACQHIATLTALLGPYGYRISLVGTCRLGNPASTHVPVVLGLTREATEAAEAVPPTEGWKVKKEEAPTQSQKHMLNKDRFAIPAAVECSFDSYRTLSLAVEPCTELEVFSGHDSVSEQLAHMYAYAVRGLVTAGYATGVRLRDPSTLATPAAWAHRVPYVVTARYDPMKPTNIPLPDLEDLSELRRLRLHRLVLHVVPWHCFHVRRLFLTGPAEFTAVLTLRALELGMELNINGLFLCERGSVEHRGHVQYGRVLIGSEKDLFTALRLPYVHPLNRGIFCQFCDVISTRSDSE